MAPAPIQREEPDDDTDDSFVPPDAPPALHIEALYRKAKRARTAYHRLFEEQQRHGALLREYAHVAEGVRELSGLVGQLLAVGARHERVLTLRSLLLAAGAAFGSGAATIALHLLAR
jgi:hypothetical protein